MSPNVNRRKLLTLIACGIGGIIATRSSAGARKALAAMDTNYYLPIVAKDVSADNPNPPSTTVRLIFIHHSTGQNWLADEHGKLGIVLRDNNYFVSDTNYGWGTDSIGSSTDIGHWYNWFLSAQRATYTAELYAETRQSFSYTRLPTNPGGENEIILFKSCFPNSAVYGSPNDPPTSANNPIYGKWAGDSTYTVGNVKGLYNDLLVYFAANPQKLFVLITPPPLVANATNDSQAANARAVNTWLVSDWLKNYSSKNVAVFDFYHVLTSNGGNNVTSDVNALTGNHHRYRENAIEHPLGVNANVSAYGSDTSDSHPTSVGGQKASTEFIKLLNIYYHRWKGV